ncbi:MAG: hypothetical protein ACREE9_03045 [Stellaceae bacterium]
MAVLVEAISVIVRRDSIERSFEGEWTAFVSRVPNATLCTDGQLARIGFMSPKAVGEFVEGLQAAGLIFSESGKCIDFVVVDQQRGPTMPCEWLEFAHIPFGKSGGKVGSCWLFEGPRMGWGIHLPGDSMDFATPSGWKFEGSLSERFTFISNEDFKSRLKYLRTEGGRDVFLDTSTGLELFIPSI